MEWLEQEESSKSVLLPLGSLLANGGNKIWKSIVLKLYRPLLEASWMDFDFP